MPEEELTGVEEGLAAEDQGISEDDLRQEQETQTVPVEALQSERKKRQELEEQLRQQQETLAVYQANMQQIQQQMPQQRQTAKRLLDTINDDEVVTARELRQIVGEVAEQFNASVVLPMSELQMMALYPDYREVLTNNLQPMLKNNPALISAIRSSDNPNLLAYTIAGGKGVVRKTPDGDGSGKPNKDLERMLKNVEKPGVPTKGTSAAGKFEKFTSMKDEDFEDYIAKIKSR